MAWRVQDGRLVVNVDEVKLVRPFLVTFDRPGWPAVRGLSGREFAAMRIAYCTAVFPRLSEKFPASRD